MSIEPQDFFHRDALSKLLLSLYQHLPPQKSLGHYWGIKEEAFLSLLIDQSALQDSLRFRGLRRAQIIASSLIDEKGDFQQAILQQWIELLETEGYIVYAEGENEGSLTDHYLAILRKLRDDIALLNSLKRFQKPLCHGWAEELVRQSLGIYQPITLTDAQIRTAVLSALLAPLRQNVGSCFATAPAILIQREQPLQLLDDLHQLLYTGKLKRVFGGVEYSVPLSPSTGVGDLRKLISGDERMGKAWLSPALLNACSLAGLIENTWSWEKKGEALSELIQRTLKEKSAISIEDFLHQSLLDSLRLSDNDIELSNRWEVARVKSGKFTTLYTAQNSPDKGELAQRFIKLEKQVRAAFKGFCDHALLKAWEFTLASFSEVKMEFSRWNLYLSLGLHHEEEGGLGQVIYRHLEDKIAQANQAVQKYQTDYEIAFDQVRATEILLKNAASESDARRLQAEYQSRVYHMQACLDMRDKSYTAGSHYTNLFSFLLKQYDAKFPEYFQEIYDAEMQDVRGDFYDDSPAGFRLVYKHGRTDPSLWTLISNSEQYIEVLVDFFNATESDVAAQCDWQGGDQEVLNITSAIISHIRTPLFLKTAFQRMAKAHLGEQAPLRAEEKKPWAYTSGGTMTTLLKTYYCRSSDLTEESRWVESEAELLIYLIDALKNQPASITDPFLKETRRGMLMASPSHAFLLLPSLPLYRKGWQEEGFTYTWVRDEVFTPSHQFYANIFLSPAEQQLLIDLFSSELPSLLSHHLQQSFILSEEPVKIIAFRRNVLEHMFNGQPLFTREHQQIIADQLDAFLYENLPIISGNEYKIVLRRLFADRYDEAFAEALRSLPDRPAPIMTAKWVKEAAKFCWVQAHQAIGYAFDLHQHIARHARFINLAAPTPLLFADTNWAGYYLGFVVNPGTGRLELWRLDQTGSRGRPMSSWQHWINGKEKKNWSIYTRPSEYSFS
jgi:hypothetical protein